MSWFPSFQLSSVASAANSTPKTSSHDSSRESGSLAAKEEPQDSVVNPDLPRGLDGHRDARDIVRLFQCQFCSLLLQQPILLPCGNEVCKKCLPKSYKRENITYPSFPSRQEGFICPFEECRQEHAVGDSSTDVTLKKIIERVGLDVIRCRNAVMDTPLQVDEKLHWRSLVTTQEPRIKDSRVLHGGRLLATFTMAELGELRYDSETLYKTLGPSGDEYQVLDQNFLIQLREIVQSEAECQVCWGLMLDPMTTTCGHSFCRTCVARLLDHSNLCPVCRSQLSIRPGATQEPSNKRLCDLLLSLVPDVVYTRELAAEAEETTSTAAGLVGLFVCTLSFPEMPTFLHVFEPRYRLMIRRAMQTDRKFGMVAYNARGEEQGELGVTQFMLYGTLLYIESMQVLPDGRSLIQARGISRFRILDHDLLDDYTVARTERLDDLPIAAEEALEANERAHTRLTNPELGTSHRPLASMSTVELMQTCSNFIERMQGASATWLATNVLQAYGDMPTDPAVFPYWFASVLPINETEKYRLLPTTSVRERLKITAGWVRKVQDILATLPYPINTRDAPVQHDNDDEDDHDDDDEEDEDGNQHEYQAQNSTGNVDTDVPTPISTQ